MFSPTLPFNTLPSYVKDGTYKLIVVRHSAEHEMFAVCIIIEIILYRMPWNTKKNVIWIIVPIFLEFTWLYIEKNE